MQSDSIAEVEARLDRAVRRPRAGAVPGDDRQPAPLAQRALPSMMTATERTVSGRSASRAGFMLRSVRSLLRRFTRLLSGKRRIRPAEVSDLHDLLFLLLQEIVDPVDVLVGQLLEPVLRTPFLVVANVTVAHQLLQVVHAVPPDVAYGDPAFLGEVPHDLDELLAPLLGQLRDRQADELAVVRRA